MAVKDHSLDDKIIRSAKKEFLKFGFEKASLHKIARNAGVTAGALYTRYTSKDDLFQSLVRFPVDEIDGYLTPIRRNYERAKEQKSPDLFIEAIQKEERIYIDMLFDYYDECVLFVCKSGGSSVGVALESMMKEKIRQTILFFKSITDREVDFDGMDFILKEQFDFYKNILERGYTKEKAISALETVEVFTEAGWRSFFEKIL